MKLSVPFSRSKRYLTGIDWTIGTLDHMSYRATGGSNASQIVLVLKGAFDDVRFRSALGEFTRQFPVLGGRSSRDWNLAPYWKMPRAGATSVQFTTRDVVPSEVHSALETSVNTRFAEPDRHLALSVLHAGGDRHYVVMHFDHRLFDAQGAEHFLELFQCWYEGEPFGPRLARIAMTEPAHLSDWTAKFAAGRQLVRKLREYADASLRVLPRPVPMMGRGFRFHVMEFSAAETRAVAERAYREAGFLMFMPYALASALQSLDGTFEARGAQGSDYIVSVSVDLRTPDTAAAKIFFNHLSFLLFRVPRDAVGHRARTLDLIRSQMYEQIKSGFPRALADSSMLMRILPQSALSRLMLKPLGGEFASLGFSCVGKGGYTRSRFMGADVENLIHMPLVPVPPGVGFVINHFGDRMNAVLSYVEGMLTDEDIRRVEGQVRRLL